MVTSLDEGADPVGDDVLCSADRYGEPVVEEDWGDCAVAADVLADVVGDSAAVGVGCFAVGFEEHGEFESVAAGWAVDGVEWSVADFAECVGGGDVGLFM